MWTDDGSLPLNSQGQLPFFLLDAHEETATPGLVYLFGKVSSLLQRQPSVKHISRPSMRLAAAILCFEEAEFALCVSVWSG